eukprot:sb/3476426/
MSPPALNANKKNNFPSVSFIKDWHVFIITYLVLFFILSFATHLIFDRSKGPLPALQGRVNVGYVRDPFVWSDQVRWVIQCVRQVQWELVSCHCLAKLCVSTFIGNYPVTRLSALRPA